MTLLDVPAPPPPDVDEPPPRQKRWTKAEFNELADRGAFDRMRVFLYRGDVIEVPTMGPRHAAIVQRLNVWMVRTFDPEFAVRSQLPFELPGESIVLPDGAVVRTADDTGSAHPTRAALVIEVSDSSVELDREKALDYAAALVPDYWLANLRAREVEVYRDPVTDPASPTGWRYASHRVHHDGESVALLAQPAAAVAVATLVGA